MSGPGSGLVALASLALLVVVIFLPIFAVVVVAALVGIQRRLVELRVLAMEERDRVGVCDHGNSGICMSCVRAGDLLRPRL